MGAFLVRMGVVDGFGGKAINVAIGMEACAFLREVW